MIAEGKKPKGKPKEITVWDYEHELLQIVEQDVFKKDYPKEFVSISLKKTDNGHEAVSNIDAEEKAAYIKKYYGKKLTCTDRVEWSTLEILDDYCKQECIENAVFRVSKDVDHFAIHPQFHWTDQKIKVHVFTCLAAIAIAEALRMMCKAKGFDIAKAAMLDKLHNIRDAWISRDGKQVIRKIEDTQDDEATRPWKYISTIKTDMAEKDVS